MRAEVIAIGDELTSGVRLDTNSQWLSQRLEEMGVAVLYQTTVGDDLDRIEAALRSALDRVEILVLSGGLGPTADDLTRHAIARVSAQPLELDPEVLEHIRQLFARRGREMPERNSIQAEFPSGSFVLANPHGTAPGIQTAVMTAATDETRHIFALPGVPAELKQMWHESVEPRLLPLLGHKRRLIRHRTIRCFGTGESDVEQRLPDLVRRGRWPSVGITASQATISLRVTADGVTPEACLEAMEPTVATIYECLGTLVYGEDDDTLQDVVGRLLEERNLTLSTAEWGTQGLLAAWLSSSTDPRPYLGGMVLAGAEALDSSLGLGKQWPADTVTQTKLVGEMAESIRARMNTTLGLAVGPAPTDPGVENSNGRIHFALATPQKVIPASSRFAAHPAIQRQRAGKEALNLARLWLLKQ